ERVGLKALLLDDLENGTALGHGNGITTESIEVDAGGEGLGDLRGGDDGSEGAAIADAFGHRHDIGDDTLGLEAPEVGAGAAEAGLDFIGDAEATGGAGVRVGVLQVAVREDDGAAYALDG